MIRHYPGAPHGNRVHWLRGELVGEFSRNYRAFYNYQFHNYRFARFRKRTLIDEFIVVRTSKKCYRVMYFNNDFKWFKYFSCRNYKECAIKMKNIFRIFIDLEEVLELEEQE